MTRQIGRQRHWHCRLSEDRPHERRFAQANYDSARSHQGRLIFYAGWTALAASRSCSSPPSRRPDNWLVRLSIQV